MFKYFPEYLHELVSAKQSSAETQRAEMIYPHQPSTEQGSVNIACKGPKLNPDACVG